MNGVWVAGWGATSVVVGGCQRWSEVGTRTGPTSWRRRFGSARRSLSFSQFRSDGVDNGDAIGEGVDGDVGGGGGWCWGWRGIGDGEEVGVGVVACGDGDVEGVRECRP